MAQHLRLSTRLILLGVSGPLVGLAIFLMMASATSLGLSRQARTELVNMFDQENRSTLFFATAVVQQSTIAANQQLTGDARKLAQDLAPLALAADGSALWKQRPLPVDRARPFLMQRLRQQLSLPKERAAIYRLDGSGQWQRYAGVTAEGQALASGWKLPESESRFIATVMAQDRRHHRTHSNVVLRNGGWWMSVITPLQSEGGRVTSVLSVSSPSDAAARILHSVNSLFPPQGYRLAFFGYTPDGQVFCDYETPGSRACGTLKAALLRSGGLPKHNTAAREVIIERLVDMRRHSPLGVLPQHLFIATFPRWNWFAVIAVEPQVLQETLGPLQQATRSALLQLSLVTLLLIGGCAFAAIKISDGIKTQLRRLAVAANSIAAGETRQSLKYDSDDALGRLVEAFNRMAGAVADREDALKAQIQTLEISINNQELSGHVSSIVNDPGFDSLSQRARAMRDRRQSQRRADDRGD